MNFFKQKFEVEFLKKSFFNDNLAIFNPTWNLKFSPYSSWTYCEPNCSTGEQAIDAENAFDNAYADTFSAVGFFFKLNFKFNAALFNNNLSPLIEQNIVLNYVPNNTLLEEYNNNFDGNTTRYKVFNGVVRYFYQLKEPNLIQNNVVQVILFFN